MDLWWIKPLCTAGIQHVPHNCNSIKHNGAMNRHWKIHFFTHESYSVFPDSFSSFTSIVLREVPWDFLVAEKQLLLWAVCLLWKEPNSLGSSLGTATFLTHGHDVGSVWYRSTAGEGSHQVMSALEAGRHLRYTATPASTWPGRRLGPK